MLAVSISSSEKLFKRYKYVNFLFCKYNFLFLKDKNNF